MTLNTLERKAMPRTAAVASCRFLCSALRQHTWYTSSHLHAQRGPPPERTRMRTELFHHHPLALDLLGSGILSLCRVSFHPCFYRYRARFRHQCRYSRPNTIQWAWPSESGVSLRRQQQPDLRRDERQPASSRCPSGRCARKCEREFGAASCRCPARKRESWLRIGFRV